MLTLDVPVEGVEDDGAGDDGVYVDVGLPESCRQTVSPQCGHTPLVSPVGGTSLEYRAGVQKGRAEWPPTPPPDITRLE